MQWLHPLWFVGLTVPALLLLLALWPGRPAEVATGALHLWRSLAAAQSSERERPRPPLALVLIALAIALAVLALARPVVWPAAPPERFEVVLDTSPSCLLPHAPTDPASPRRIELALAAWAEFAARRAAELARAGRTLEVLWHAADLAAPLLASGAAPPEEVRALLAGGVPGPEPEWERFDRPGVVWLSDRARSAAHAAVCASGGPLVPGPIGEDGGRLVSLQQDGALALGPPVAPGALVRTGALPAPIAALAQLWAEERGLALDAPGVTARLVVAGPAAAAAAELGPLWPVARDGWSGRARFPRDVPGPASGAGEAWLDAGERPAVEVARGRVTVHIAELEIDGDSARFAASFAAALDAALAPDPRVVPYAERRAAGEPSAELPSTEGAPAARVAAKEYAPWCGALAAALAAAGLALGARGRRGAVTVPAGPLR